MHAALLCATASVVGLLAIGTALDSARAQQADDGQYVSHPLMPTAEISVASGASGVTIYIGVQGTIGGSPGSPGGNVPQGGTDGPRGSAEPMKAGNSVTTPWLSQGFQQQ